MLDEKPGFHLRPQDSRLSLFLSSTACVCACVGMCVCVCLCKTAAPVRLKIHTFDWLRGFFFFFSSQNDFQGSYAIGLWGFSGWERREAT